MKPAGALVCHALPSIAEGEKLVNVQENDGDHDCPARPHHLARVLLLEVGLAIFDRDKDLEKNVVRAEDKEGTEREEPGVLLGVDDVRRPLLRWQWSGTPRGRWPRSP